MKKSNFKISFAGDVNVNDEFVVYMNNWWSGENGCFADKMIAGKMEEIVNNTWSGENGLDQLWSPGNISSNI